MSAKPILIIFILVVLIGGGVAFFILKPNPVSQNTTQVAPVTPTLTSVLLSTWTDEAGFSFQYPQETSVDKHPEDTKNYANLTLTLPSQDTVDIVMADNTFKDLSAWVGQNSAIDTTLGGQSAKKVIKDGVITVACIDNEVLVTVTGKDISGIVDSWTFIYPTPKTTNTTNDSGDVLEEE